jgi:hypothetical protein
MGQIYEAYGAFEGALAVYQQIVTTLSFYTKYTEVSKRKHKPIDFIVYKCICVHDHIRLCATYWLDCVCT